MTSEGLEKDLATSALSRWAIVREMASNLSQGTLPGRVKPRLFIWGSRWRKILELCRY